MHDPDEWRFREYAEGHTNDSPVDLSGREGYESLKCEYCGDELDEELAGEPCLDCKRANEREKAEEEYWKEVNRTAYVTSQYNNGSR